MITNISFKIEWDYDQEKSSGLTIKGIYCGDADGAPVPIYFAVLEMMMLVEDNLNGERLHEGLPQLTPEAEAAGRVIEENLKVNGMAPAKLRRIVGDVPPSPVTKSPPPPTPKTVVKPTENKYKRFTVEEKTEIAMMYASGIPLQAIAEKFNRSTAGIQKLISTMGVHRGDDVMGTEQGDTPAEESDRPKEKKRSALEKPWYLKSQTTIKERKKEVDNGL